MNLLWTTDIHCTKVVDHGLGHLMVHGLGCLSTYFRLTYIVDIVYYEHVFPRKRLIELGVYTLILCTYGTHDQFHIVLYMLCTAL